MEKCTQVQENIYHLIVKSNDRKINVNKTN